MAASSSNAESVDLPWNVEETMAISCCRVTTIDWKKNNRSEIKRSAFAQLRGKAFPIVFKRMRTCHNWGVQSKQKA